MGFTHIELLPVSEHPLDDSWGYQPIGLFAPTSRHGDPAAFARFVDIAAHAASIGVILDWVPAHFLVDAHGLAHFDGRPLYEDADKRRGFHPDWNTAIYDFGRAEVANFLAASALYWLDRFHIDGLRVDAVASMLYLDYSRKAGEWSPNVQGGNTNLEAVALLRRVNTLVYGEHPGTVTIAEESTSWPGVCLPVDKGGLGFGFKWNLGWMHDTLDYFHRDPVHRRYHHNDLTFGLLYAFSENFILPLSHDEVVHGKGSVVGRMPGDDWQRFATLRAYYAFMWAYPGKKLLFMGQEFGQYAEWDFHRGLDWQQGARAASRRARLPARTQHALSLRARTACARLRGRGLPLDRRRRCPAVGFRLDALRRRRTMRRSSPSATSRRVPRKNYRIGLPHAGTWREVMNTDAGVGLWRFGRRQSGAGSGATAKPSHGFPASAALTSAAAGDALSEVRTG